MIRLGDTRKVKPGTFSVTGENGKEKELVGTVAYIHPARRYCTLEFEVGNAGAKIRESFKIVEGEIFT